MPADTPCPPDHPLMIAWNAYKQTEAYQNSVKWLEHPEHRQGSMWAAFSQGFAAGAEAAKGQTNAR